MGSVAGLRAPAWMACMLAMCCVLTACQRGDDGDGGLLADADNWPSFGRSDGEQHYSPLREVNLSTIDRLSLAWSYDLPPGNTLTGPVAADGKLFVTSGHSFIRAFNAETGALLWEYDARTREDFTQYVMYGWGPKGLAYWNGRVFIGTQDGRVIALDANHGRVLWQQRDYPLGELRYINGPPRVFNGLVIVGHGGADASPIRGYVTAYNAMTGERAWRFYTVPGNPADGFENDAMRAAAETWTGEWWRHGGGGTAWNAFSYDPELNLIYLGVGNGYPYNQALRSPDGGDNLYLASIVAVRADTGEHVWHYQVCPGEQWDCVATMDMTLATLRIGGRERRVLMQAPKNGFFYVIDRETGELLSAEPFARVTWAERIDLETGRPVENPGIRYHGRAMFEMWPSARGAHSWLPQSFSPRTGLVYIPVIEGATIIGDQGLDLSNPRIGRGVTFDPDPDLPGARRSYLKAWDPVAQRERWRVELPGNWPGGTMATAGDLVFQGRIDGRFVAYDARNGHEVWSVATGAPVVAPPISYAVNGRQYVTVITGNGASGGGIMSAGLSDYRTDYRLPRRILTFAVGGRAAMPPIEMSPLTRPDDPTYRMDAAREAAGARAFAMGGCLVCHGVNAVGGGTAPDLRYSAYPANREAFHGAVHGDLVSAGMPPFQQLPEADVESIRQYLRGLGQRVEVSAP